MAGLLTYSLSGAFPFHPPKLLSAAKEDYVLSFSGHPPLLKQWWVTVAKSA